MTEESRNGPETVRVSFDTDVGVLTASLEPAPAVDVDDVVEDFVAYFDRQEPGRLARVQVLVPEDRRGAWRTILPDYLGPTVAACCLARIDTNRHTSQETLVIPPLEWVDLRQGAVPRLSSLSQASIAWGSEGRTVWR